MGPPAARRPADRRPAALPARPAAPRSATGPLVPVMRNAQRGHAHSSAPWSSGRAAAIVRKQPGAEHQPLALKQRRGRARRPAKIPCGRLFVRRRGRLDACCEPGGASKSTPPLLRPEGVFKGSVGAWLHPRKRLAMMGRAPQLRTILLAGTPPAGHSLLLQLLAYLR